MDLSEFEDGPTMPTLRAGADFSGGIDLSEFHDPVEPAPTPEATPTSGVDLSEFEDKAPGDPMFSLDAHSPLDASGGPQGEAGAGPDWETIRRRGVGIGDVGIMLGSLATRHPFRNTLLGETALHALGRYGEDESGKEIAAGTGRDLVSTATGLAADFATSMALRKSGVRSAVARLLAPLVAGPLARKVAGGDPFDPVGIAGDALIGPALTAGHGYLRGVQTARTSPASDLPNYQRELTPEGIQEMPPTFPVENRPVGPQARDDAQRGLLDAIMEPVGAGRSSSLESTQDLAEREYQHARYERRVGKMMDEVSDVLRGVKNDPNSPVDLRGVTHLLTEYSDPVHHNRETNALADYMRNVYQAFGELGRRAGYFDPTAPLKQRYGGRLIPRNASQAPDVVTAAQQLRAEAGGLRDLQARPRHGTFDPAYNEDDASVLWDDWRRQHESGIVAALPFGPKPRDVMPRLHGYVGDVIRRQEGRSAQGLTVHPLTYTRMANRIRNEATVSAEHQNQLLDIARQYDDLAGQGLTGSAHEIMSDLKQRQEAFEPAPINSRGVIANDLIARSMQDPGVASGQGPEASKLRQLTDTLRAVYDRPMHGPWDKTIAKLLGSVSNVLLARSAPLQVGQIPGNIAHMGLEKSAEGLAQWLHDPSYKPLMEASGGMGGAIARHVEEMRPGQTPNRIESALSRLFKLPSGQTPTSWGMRVAEGVNRGIGASGLLPHYRGTSEEAARWHGGGMEGIGPPRSLDIPEELAYRMRDLGISPTGPFTPTAEGFIKAQGLVDDIQLLSGSAGRNSQAVLGSPGRRAFWQFGPFAMGAARLGYRNYLTPMGHGLANLPGKAMGRDVDISGLRLASDRLARLLPASIVAETVGRGTADFLSGKMMSDPADKYKDEFPGSVGRRMMGTNAGMPWDVGNSAYRGFMAGPWEGKYERSYGRRGMNAGLSLLKDRIPPIVDLIEKGDPVKVGASALGYFSPTAGSLAALIGQPLYNLLIKGGDEAAAKQPPTDRFMDDIYNSGQMGDLMDAYRQSGGRPGDTQPHDYGSGSDTDSEYFQDLSNWIRRSDQPSADLHHPLLRGHPGPGPDATMRYLKGRP